RRELSPFLPVAPHTPDVRTHPPAVQATLADPPCRSKSGAGHPAQQTPRAPCSLATDPPDALAAPPLVVPVRTRWCSRRPGAALHPPPAPARPPRAPPRACAATPRSRPTRYGSPAPSPGCRLDPRTPESPFPSTSP